MPRFRFLLVAITLLFPLGAQGQTAPFATAVAEDALGAVALSLWSRCPRRHLAGTGAESSRKQWFFENSSR